MLVVFNGSIGHLDVFQSLYPWITLNDVIIATEEEIQNYNDLCNN